MWQVPLNGASAGSPSSIFEGRYGRIRTVVRAPGGRSLWFSTSNRDGYGSARSGDDRILSRLDPVVRAAASRCSSPPPRSRSSGAAGATTTRRRDGRPSRRTTSTQPAESGSTSAELGKPEVVATGLQVPWGLAFLPDGDLLVGERTTGRILRVPKDGGKPVVVKELPGVDKDIGEGGLLGLAVSPDYAKDKQVYAYYTGAEDNRVVHFSLDGDETPIVTGIYRSTNHDGGRLAFGPDGKLYVTTGDGLEGSRSQDPANPGGKILRIEPGRLDPGRQPRQGQPVLDAGPPQRPGPGLGRRRSAVGERVRREHLRRGQPHREGQELRLARGRGRG